MTGANHVTTNAAMFDQTIARTAGLMPPGPNEYVTPL
jgi:hypothetical protein